MIDQNCLPTILKVYGKNRPFLKKKCQPSFFACLKLILITFVLVIICQLVHAASLSLSWDSSNGAMGYKIYYGLESRNYPFVVDIGPWTQCIIADLDLGHIYFFAVTAYNEYEESDLSGEIAYRPTLCDADLDIDGDIDGPDLADIIANPSAATLSDFAAGFGKEECNIE